MTGHDDFDRALAGWFEEVAAAPAPTDGLDRAIDATRHRRPRPAWLAALGGHWISERPNAGLSTGVRSLQRLGPRWSTVLILLLTIAAVVGGAILVGALLFKPSPLPTGRLGHLAYGLDGGMFVADWDGRNPVRIADGRLDGPTDCQGIWAEGRTWSPDGRHLAYRSGSAFCPSAIVSISDTAGHVVASFPGTGWLVSWSPDSTRVATWVELTKTVGIYGLDGVRQALLTLPPGQRVGGDADPVWSPDGKSLLIRLAPSTLSTPVWELPVDGGTPRPVPSNDPRSHWDASYSRDGSRVAFNEVGYLVVAAADGTQRRLLAQAGNSIVWSPTGDRVAFTWSYDVSGPWSNIRVMEVASGNVWEVAGGQPISFSPEGDRILYSRTTHNREVNRDESSLWSVNVGNSRTVDGSDGRSLVSGYAYAFENRQLVTGTSWGDWQWQPAGQ